MTITDANIYTSVYSDIRTVLVAAAPYVINSSTGTTTAAGIEAEYNDKYTSKPQIIIESPIKTEDTFKFGTNEGKKFINISIDCFYKNSLGIDQLGEQVEAAIKNNNFSGMDLIGVASDYAFTNPNQTKYQMKGITFTFDRE